MSLCACSMVRRCIYNVRNSHILITSYLSPSIAQSELLGITRQTHTQCIRHAIFSYY
jgi:hypothetical protein